MYNDITQLYTLSIEHFLKPLIFIEIQYISYVYTRNPSIYLDRWIDTVLSSCKLIVIQYVYFSLENFGYFFKKFPTFNFLSNYRICFFNCLFFYLAIAEPRNSEGSL